jgi:hypothetical protein
MCENGFDWPYRTHPLHGEKCLTIFSSPDYCEQGNKAAVLKVPAEGNFSLVQFGPLSEKEQANRRVIPPKWLLEESSPVSFYDGLSPDSEPNIYQDDLDLTELT